MGFATAHRVENVLFFHKLLYMLKNF